MTLELTALKWEAFLNQCLSLKWAFNSEIGATMEAELIEGNTKFVVAYLTDALHEGDPEFESIKAVNGSRKFLKRRKLNTSRIY